jgi:FkbM family methyltransferase
MKFIKKTVEVLFNILIPVLKFEIVQRLMRVIGIKLPYYRFAEKLNYRDIVPFKVGDKNFKLQSHNGPIEMFIFWYGIFGFWEATQLKKWSELVIKNDVVLDIGSNTGVYSILACLNTNVKVFAFEPVPAVRDMLSANVILNNLEQQISIESKVVSDSLMPTTLFVPRSGWVDVASINENFAKGFLRNEKMTEVVCESTTVDNFLTENIINLDSKILCKIDVEGAEDRVISGMQETLQKYDITFMIEILDNSGFENLVKSIPASFTLEAIDELQKSVYPCRSFVPGVTNYLCQKV